MGRTLLILLAGFATSFGVLAMSKNSRLFDSVDRMVGQLTDHSAQNAATSGAYLALNQLYVNRNWRGQKNFVLDGNTVAVDIQNDSVGGAPVAYQVKIHSASSGAQSANGLAQVVIFDRNFQDFSVWARDTVLNIAAQDSASVPNDSLIMKRAPFMPKINDGALVSAALSQSHYFAGSFTPSTGYPNGSYYASGVTPNVTFVGGNFRVRTGRTVYGIYIVTGEAQFEGGGNLEGVLYLPNATTSKLKHYDADPSLSLIKGGVVTWGKVDGTGGNIVVRHDPTYFDRFVADYASSNPPIRVLTWK